MNTLEKITAKKFSNLNDYKELYPTELLKKKISSYNNYIDFKKKLDNKNISIIAEIKKASPSAGVIIENYDPIKIAQQYLDGKASCLSILTEENFFKGKLEHINEVKKKVKLPVLCKDFFIDPFQVYLAKAAGADAILIILAAVDDVIAKKIYNLAIELNISIIVEVHTKEEANRALHFEEAIIGINNRNLKTLKTDISVTFNLYHTLKNHSQPLICESGIKTESDVTEILKKTKINNFLIGESLLKSKDIASSLKKFTQISSQN